MRQELMQAYARNWCKHTPGTDASVRQELMQAYARNWCKYTPGTDASIRQELMQVYARNRCKYLLQAEDETVLISFISFTGRLTALQKKN